MNCPVCNEPMVVLELEQVEVDHCPGCKGIWLDEGELEMLLDDADRAYGFLDSFEVDDQTAEKTRKCPICRKRMEKVLCGADSAVQIDRCGKNRDGLWFDCGELASILRLGGLGADSTVLDLLRSMFDFSDQ